MEMLLTMMPNIKITTGKAFREDLYEDCFILCHFVSLLTDGNALELFETINGKKKD
jgi:hypothetical protein